MRKRMYQRRKLSKAKSMAAIMLAGVKGENKQCNRRNGGESWRINMAAIMSKARRKPAAALSSLAMSAKYEAAGCVGSWRGVIQLAAAAQWRNHQLKWREMWHDWLMYGSSIWLNAMKPSSCLSRRENTAAENG